MFTARSGRAMERPCAIASLQAAAGVRESELGAAIVKLGEGEVGTAAQQSEAVVVTDEAGQPRPSARIEFGSRRGFDVVGDVQRLDHYTDADGCRTLERVEPGEATITAIWGSRRGARKVHLRDGEEVTVRIVAR